MKKMFLLLPLFLMLSGFSMPKEKDLVHIDDVEWTKQTLAERLEGKNEWTDEADTSGKFNRIHTLLHFEKGSATIRVKENKVAMVEFFFNSKREAKNMLNDIGFGVSKNIIDVLDGKLEGYHVVTSDKMIIFAKDSDIFLLMVVYNQGTISDFMDTIDKD